MKGIFEGLESFRTTNSKLEETLRALPVIATLDSEDEPNISEEEMRYEIHQNTGHGYDTFNFHIVPLRTGNVQGVLNYRYDSSMDPNSELKWNGIDFGHHSGVSLVFRGNGYILYNKDIK